MRNIKLIIFDFDGTLCDTQRNIVLTLKATIAERQLPKRTDEQCISIIGLPLKECFRVLFPGLDEDSVQLCADTYRRIFAETLANVKPSPFPHVVQTIRQLKQLGFTLTIASSRSHASLVELSKTMEIDDCFSLYLGADDVLKAKPEPEPVLMTMKSLGFLPEETLVVGDMPVDILMGSRAGVTTVGVSYGNSSSQDLQNVRADYIIDSFSQLLIIIHTNQS